MPMSKYRLQTENYFASHMSKYNAVMSGTAHIQILMEDKEEYDRICTKMREGILEMGRNDQCFCGSGKKYKNCCNDISENSILADLLYQYHQLDEKISKMVEEKNISFLCKKGCHACCSDYFYVSMAEYFVIRRALVKLNQFDRVKQKATESYQLFLNTYPEEIKKLQDSTLDIDSMFQENPIIKSKCPLLENGKCSVYQYRPFICRLHGTSYKYNLCEKIKKHCSKLLKKTS